MNVGMEKKVVELEIVTFKRRMRCCTATLSNSLQIPLYSFIDPSASRLSTHKLEFMIPNRKVERKLSIPSMQFSIWSKIYNQLIKGKDVKFMVKLLQHVTVIKCVIIISSIIFHRRSLMMQSKNDEVNDQIKSNSFSETRFHSGGKNCNAKACFEKHK
jgi:hypothetical protein